jgi:hypothetical protein
MEQGRDHIDDLIYDSFENIETYEHKHKRNDEEYKLRLRERLHNNNTQNSTVDKNQSRGRFHTAAISLITAGILLGFMYTTEMHSSLIQLEYTIKTDYALIKTNFNIEKLFLGE